eukprot:gene18623-24358_t
MDVLLSQISAYTTDKRAFLTYLTYGCGFFTLPLTICSFVVAGTANAGFNAVLTAVLNIAFTGESYYVVKNSKTPIAIGFLIGSVAMMTLLNLMTAIYWGQLSKCEVIYDDIAQYTCVNRSAYGALCSFATFLFIIQVVLTTLLILWRGELISEVGLYEEVTVPSSFDIPANNKSYEYKPTSNAQSADL